MRIFDLVMFILFLLLACWRVIVLYFNLIDRKSIIKNCIEFVVLVLIATVFYMQFVS